MAQSALNKQTHGLINLYLQLWAAKYGKAPTINRYREKWGFQSMIEDVGYDRAKEIVEYYFKTPKRGHPLSYLLFNYDRLHRIMEELAADEVKRAELRARTAVRVKTWEELNGN